MRWLEITRPKKMDSCWEALISTGGTASRGGDDERGYIALLLDSLASNLFTYSYARK